MARPRGLQRPTTRGGWKAPAVGGRARKAMPRSAFLIPSQRKYPYKVMRGGRWVTSPQGLMAARKRAAQQKAKGSRGAATAERRAVRLLNPIRRRQGKLPLKIKG